MIQETVLRCTCGREVAVVRLNADTLALGHTTNPGLASHPVRLASPAARNAAIPVAATGQPEARGDAPVASTRTTRATRSESNGMAESRNTPSRTSSLQGGRCTRVPSAVGTGSAQLGVASTPLGAGAHNKGPASA